ncbi:transporter substrate-binding domain-containing protein [Agarivorans sp. MS3-6]|uniref:transporter substrate-binding domain-containing protein n=1 Tax=Agarivorans sp. TSD2052 TaxID=2937286 RepID=UPI00200F008C|nr:transporter substrate-binding domain-containing protein [Agarivorans sp. TSD2052]UPW17298.1 transporter substrate-binding domain-containing protein [Agarivorans sp. TSD2052]
MFKLKSLIASTVLVLSMFASTIAQADQLATVMERGVLKVAVPQDFPPFGSVGSDLQPQGYDIDMASYLAKELGVKLELVPVTSANRIPYLQTRKVDLVISSLGKNAEREKAIDFSDAYAPFFLGVFGAEEIKVASAAELAGKTIGVTRGAVEDIELSKLVDESTTIKRFEDNNTTLSAYLSGQVELIATGNLVATEIAKRVPTRKPAAKFMLKNSPCYVGVLKGEEALVAKVNDLIAKAKSDGDLEKLSLAWFKTSLPAGL